MAKLEQWHKRHAITLACQLPDNVEDAWLVIEATRDLVENFIRKKPPEQLPKTYGRSEAFHKTPAPIA